jgi:hypothetical protein
LIDTALELPSCSAMWRPGEKRKTRFQYKRHKTSYFFGTFEEALVTLPSSVESKTSQQDVVAI